MYDAVLLDLYDTFAWSAWPVWQQTLAEHLGVTYEEVGRAFDATRPIRPCGPSSRNRSSGACTPTTTPYPWCAPCGNEV